MLYLSLTNWPHLAPPHRHNGNLGPMAVAALQLAHQLHISPEALKLGDAEEAPPAAHQLLRHIVIPAVQRQG